MHKIKNFLKKLWAEMYWHQHPREYVLAKQVRDYKCALLKISGYAYEYAHGDKHRTGFEVIRKEVRNVLEKWEDNK